MIHIDAHKLLSLLFNEGEHVCVSEDKFAYRSILVDELFAAVFELTPNHSGNLQDTILTSSDKIKLLSINPIKGDRLDENCTAYRTFLVEVDDRPLGAQLAYIQDMQMPYSACVFSGGKSLHFAITLDEDLPSQDIWRFYSEWILNVMRNADQNTKNPSRMIRFPGTLRDGVEQKLVSIGQRISLDTLKAWLAPYDGLKPIVSEKKTILTTDASILSLPQWVKDELAWGISTEKGRNNRWFAIAYECGLHGFTEDGTIAILEPFFQEERDFKRREWLVAIKSGVNKAQKT